MPAAEKSAEQTIVESLDHLRHGYWTAADRLTAIGKYFEFLAEKTDYDRMHVDAFPSTLRRFDSVVLLFRDELQGHEESVREDALRLLTDDLIAQVLGALANLTPADLDSIRVAHRRKAYPSFFRAFIVAMNSPISSKAATIEDFGLSPKSVLTVKMRLGRLAELTRYIASLDHEPNEPDFERFRKYYDPARLDLDRILGYLATARSYVASVADEPLRLRLDRTLAEVEFEVRRPRPRWGKIVATLLFLLGVAANVKEVAPGVYEDGAQVLRDLMTYILEGGHVGDRRTSFPLALPSPPTVRTRSTPDEDD